MGDFRYAACRSCGRSREEVGELSWRRLCTECGSLRMEANTLGLVTMDGPFAQWWRYRMAASVGFAPLDEAPPQP